MRRSEPRSTTQGLEARQSFETRVALGRTGITVSKLGLGSSYGARTAAYEEAFERGINYFYWGTRRRAEMQTAIRYIARKNRESLVVVIQSYARAGFLVKLSLERALRSLRLDHADLLLLGWHNTAPSSGILDACADLVERGRVRHIALSGHHRALFAGLLAERRIDVWHVRYNAVHRGAEREVFTAVSALERSARPGIVTFTTTRWGHLCDPRRTPPGERTPTGTDCYRFALTHPDVDVALAGPSNPEHMRLALRALELGPMDEEELSWMRRVGDYIHRRDATTLVRDRI
jgi:aryl-alcohol dehydrogenase-like predicted oxidoreductase